MPEPYNTEGLGAFLGGLLLWITIGAPMICYIAGTDYMQTLILGGIALLLLAAAR